MCSNLNIQELTASLKTGLAESSGPLMRWQYFPHRGGLTERWHYFAVIFQRERSQRRDGSGLLIPPRSLTLPTPPPHPLPHIKGVTCIGLLHFFHSIPRSLIKIGLGLILKFLYKILYLKLPSFFRNLDFTPRFIFILFTPYPSSEFF